MKKIGFLITFIFLLSSYALAEDYSSYLQELKGNMQQYNTQSSVGSVKEITPQYDENKTNYVDSQDSAAANKFLDYGSSISNDCTVTINELTKKAKCDERTEYKYYATPVTQNKILVNLDYESENFINEKIVYYCSENDVVYNTNAQCNVNCTYETCDPSYYMSGKQCYSNPHCQTDYTYVSGINKCRKYISRYECSIGGSYSSLSKCKNNCSNTRNATTTSTCSVSGSQGVTASQFRVADNIKKYRIYMRASSCSSTTVVMYIKYTSTISYNDQGWSSAVERYISVPKNGGSATAITTSYGHSTIYTYFSYRHGRITLTSNTAFNHSTLTYTPVLRYSTSYSCPSGYALSGTKCVKTGTCSDKSYNAYASATCTYGGSLNTSLGKCVDSVNTNYTACDPQTEYYDDIRYNAVLEYILSPSNFHPLVNCIMGNFTCIDSRNTCKQKASSGSCNVYKNICFEYTRGGSCDRVEEHIYTDCSFKTTSKPVE